MTHTGRGMERKIAMAFHTDSGLMMVPDTLDLRRRASLALRCYQRLRDEKNGLPYFYTFLRRNPPVAGHDEWDFGDVTSRLLGAALACRQVAGGCEWDGLVGELKETFLWLRGDDGLVYRRPISQTPDEKEWPAEQANMFDQSRALEALVNWWLAERSPEVGAMLEQMVHTLRRIAQQEGEQYWFPQEAFSASGWSGPWAEADPCHYSAGVHILPLMRFYEDSGSREALDLAKGLVSFVTRRSQAFAEDGSFFVRQDAEGRKRWFDEGHFHSRISTLIGMAKYALASDNQELLDWAIRGYWFSRSIGSTFGWFPEGTGVDRSATLHNSETCCITDMIHFAGLLARRVDASYWDHVEQYGVNHLMECQILDTAWVSGVPHPADTDMHTYHNLADRVMGGFVGRTVPNRWFSSLDSGAETSLGCCMGAGGFGLYLLWDQALESRPDGEYVNLAISRSGSKVDVDSYLPYQGRLDIRVKTPCSLRIRMPQWVNPATALVTVNGFSQSATCKGGYIVLADMAPADEVTVAFPLRRTVVRETVVDREYEVTWRGNTVVRLTPEAGQFGLYRRQAMDQERMPWRIHDGVSAGHMEPIHW